MHVKEHLHPVVGHMSQLPQHCLQAMVNRSVVTVARQGHSLTSCGGITDTLYSIYFIEKSNLEVALCVLKDIT